ncbi:hypothetical protein [Sphingomonas sp.]|uniref:hypothetical protein n=1 Tax=Sphingomonas sp. TaxID=28214 RepID=UPI00286BC4EF|nr:hypothetical protein [Sphingomonas sp.]
MTPDNLQAIKEIVPLIALISILPIGGWVATTWMRIKHGYPLDGQWGQALHPRQDKESVERIKLLSTENAQLRAELGSVKDRLETIERIVTDRPGRLAQEIDQLSLATPRGNA